MVLYGPDISNNNGAIEWDAAEAAERDGETPIAFGICKASEADDFRDLFLPANWQSLKRLGKLRGMYHFARPSACSAAAEAALFLATAARVGLEAGDWLILDIEDTRVPVGANLSPWVLEWCAIVAAAAGFDPVIYTYPSYIPERNLTDPALARYPLWYASYDGDPAKPYAGPVPAPWREVALWQYTAFKPIAGIGGEVDYNRFEGDAAAWRALGKPAAALTIQTTANPDPVTGYWIHPAFLAAYRFAEYGRPLAPAAMYSDGTLRQWFERGLYEWNGRGEPHLGAMGHAAALAPVLGAPLDFPDVHPLT